MAEESYDLRELSGKLAAAFPNIQALYLFGSRRYRTGSPRSDVDILVEVREGAHIRPQEMRAFCAESCPALDLFFADGGRAVSCANESRVQAQSFGTLVARLEAVCFWTRDKGPLFEADINWKFRIPLGIEFIPTAMLTGEPVSGRWRPSLRAHLQEVEAAGLPIKPYIGSTPMDIADFLIAALRRLVIASRDLASKGKGWSVRIDTVYDFQNLFFLAFKPWLPGLGREDVTIRYDGQDKSADFNICGNQIILEMKYVRDANSKAAVAKTLSGLSNFYEMHPNVRVIVFAIFAAKNVELDDAKWESDFSYTEHQPQVWTRIFRES
jgi:DpnII restriction endonuclease/nucleotidyltransferase-like protein